MQSFDEIIFDVTYCTLACSAALYKGLSIKDVCSQEGLPSADILRTRVKGVLHMLTSALFGAKNIGFFEI